MDLDQDLLDRLDRQEGPGALPTLMLGGGLAVLAGTVAYFTFKIELSVSGEVAADAAMLTFIASSVALSISHSRLR
jgi:hypothetical protein